MLRTRWLVSLALLTALVQAAPATAQERSPLSLVPEKAPLVVGIRGYKSVTDRALKMVSNAMPDLAPKLKDMLDDAMKKGLDGREAALKGINDSGPIILAFLEMPKPGAGEPNAVAIVSIKDYKAFRDGVLKEDERKEMKKSEEGIETATIEGKAVYFVDLKEYAIVASTEATARLYSKRKFEGIDKRISAEDAKKVLSSDVAIYVDMSPILEEHAEHIRQAQDSLGDIFAQVEAVGAGKIDKGQIKLAQTVVSAMLRTVLDSRSVILTASFEPDGLAVHTNVGLARDSVTAKFLQDMKPASLESLKRLPAGFLSYTGSELDAKMFKLFQPLTQGIFADPETEAGKAVAKAMEQIVAAGPKSSIVAQNVPLKGLTVTEYNDPVKALAGHMQMMEALAKGEQFQFMPVKDGIKIKKNAQTYRDSEWHQISMKWDLDKMFADIPGGGEELIKGMRKMMGDGITIWMGVLDKSVVGVSAPDWQTAQQLLDQYANRKNDLSDDNNFRTLREHLPKESSIVQIINMSKYLDVVGKMVAPMLAALGQNLEIPASKEKSPAYVGFATTLESRRISVDVFISGGAMREVQRVVEPIMRNFGGGI
jgi:hypothetical protein